MIETNTCPCCGRHCDLSEPHCERGEEYKRTGVITERGNDSSGGHGDHDHHGQRFENNDETSDRHGKQEHRYKTDDGEHGEYGGHKEHGCHGSHGKGRGRDKNARCHEKDIEDRNREGEIDQEKRIRYRQEYYDHADTNDRLVINLRELGHMIRFRFEGKGSQDRTLTMLQECGTITQRELTERLGIKPGSASEVLTKLERSGLILRNPNCEDRRMIDISLTEEGMEKAQEAVLKRKRRRAEMFSNLTEEEKETLLALLEKMNHDWTDLVEEQDCHGHGDRHGRFGHDSGHKFGHDSGYDFHHEPQE